MISTQQSLTELYFKAKVELDIMESNLKKNFSKTLLKQCYQVQNIIRDLEKILGTEINQVP